MTRGRKLGFSLATVAGLVLVFEIAARIAGVCDCQAPVPSTGSWQEMQADARYLWRLTPNFDIQSPGGTTHINAVGLRDTLLPQRKGPRERRVLTTGDSSVYGWGIPPGQTYQERLEEGLHDTFPGVRFEVVNLGVPGYSTVQTLRLLDDVGWSYEPDLLIVSNVFSDCNIDVFQDEEALALVNPDESPVRASRTYCTLWNAYARWYSTANQERNRVLMPGLPRDTALLEKVDQIVDLSRVPLPRYLDNLEAMRVGAGARGAGMLLAPLAQEWDVGQWTVPSLPRPTPAQVLPWMPYRDAMAAYATTHGIGLVSMPEAFATSPRRNARLFNDPVHPSIEGAAIMADALLAWLVQHPESLRLSPADRGAPPRPGGGP